MERIADQHRYEIVLLEDNPATLELLRLKLAEHGIIVHGYVDGQKALNHLLNSPHIGVFLTDIEIRYPFPHGNLSGLQGYDVANRIHEQASERLLSIIVLTNLPHKKTLKLLNSFGCKHFTFSKEEWEGLADHAQQDTIFSALALLVKEHVQRTPVWWLERMKAQKPNSPWVSGRKPLWEIYRELWMSANWETIEARITKRSADVLKQYADGNHRPLQGGYITLEETPNSDSFLDYLVGRRVVYAVRKIEPVDWEKWLQGNEEVDEIPNEMDFWDKIKSERLRTTLNSINSLKAQLASLGKQRGLSNEFTAGKRECALQLLAVLIKEANVAAANEPDTVQVGVAGIVRELETLIEHSHAGAGQIKKSKSKPKPENRLQATLRLLGIEKKHIKDPDPSNWKLLLPEEAIWLKSIRG